MTSRLLWGTALALMLAAGTASAQIAVSGNDNRRRLVNGQNQLVTNPPADTATIIDMGGARPRVLGEVALSHSVVGPPNSVAITPDERFAIVTSAERIDPANPSRAIPDNRVQVVDLRATPPRVVQTIEAGAGPSGVSVNAAGNLVLVANRNGGSVSVFRLATAAWRRSRRSSSARRTPRRRMCSSRRMGATRSSRATPMAPAWSPCCAWKARR
jgi:DNA-binding beta-propeller fold protein YncE